MTKLCHLSQAGNKSPFIPPWKVQTNSVKESGITKVAVATSPGLSVPVETFIKTIDAENNETSFAYDFG
ncbi:MAG: hypothetical protein WD627_13150, partial [Actinomycetota bacterium]